MRRRDFVHQAASAAGCSLFGVPAAPLATTVAGETPGRRSAPTVPHLDAHAHVHSAAVADLVEQRMGQRVLEPVSANDLVARLEADGVLKALVLSGAYLMANDVWGDTGPDEWGALRAENDYAAGEVAKHADRLTGFLSLNPKRAYAVEEIDRCVDDLGMRGVKMHFWNSVVNLRDADELAAVKSTFEHCASRELPVVVHAFNGALPNYGPDDLETFVREIVVPLPRLRISFAHLTGAGGFGFRVISHWSRLLKLMPPDVPGSERVFVDLAAVLFARATERFAASNDSQKEIMGDLLGQWGLHRVLWGSDNVDDYLSLSRDAWPRSEEEWNMVATDTGHGFLQY